MTTYRFLPWLRQGLSGRITTSPASGSARASLTLSATLVTDAGQQPLTLPDVALLGPGDVVDVDARQVVRTDPVDGATGFELDHYPSIDFDSPALPWLFTPAPPVANRLTPWLCLVAVRQQDGVSLRTDARNNATVLRLAAPTVPSAELPNLADAWAFAHVQVSGEIVPPDTLASVIDDQPHRVVSRLLCSTPLRAHNHYYACVVPTFAAGRRAGLGQADPSAANPLAPAWSAGDTTVTLPVYHYWRFSTGDGGDFAALAGALRFAPAPAGTGQRALTLDHSGLTAPTGAVGLPPLTGALCAVGTQYVQPPSWVRSALAPVVGQAAGVGAPIYGGDQTGVRRLGAGDPGWLAELNLDPRHRVVAALGDYVVADQQEQLVSAAWTQAGALQQANELIGGAQVALAVGTSLQHRHLTPLTPRTLTQVAAPLQATASADPADTTAYRRVLRARGPVARRAVPDPPPPVPPEPDPALLAAMDPQTAVVNRLQERITVPGGGVPQTRVQVAPTFPTPMYAALARVAPHLVLPGAAALPPDSVTVLQTNPRFVAAFLAGLNSAIVAELRWRGFPIDPRATPFRHFWDWRGGSAATPTPDIAPMASWPTGAGLDQVVTGPAAGAVVIAVRGELLRRHPRTAIYAVMAASPTTMADETVASHVVFPSFGGMLGVDIRFLGFPLSVADLVSGGDFGFGYFIVFQEQPTETRFGPPAGGGAPQAGAGTTAADVAQRTLHPPLRVAIPGATLLTPAPSGSNP